jgi:hypothetical protein
MSFLFNFTQIQDNFWTLKMPFLTISFKFYLFPSNFTQKTHTKKKTTPIFGMYEIYLILTISIKFYLLPSNFTQKPIFRIFDNLIQNQFISHQIHTKTKFLNTYTWNTFFWQSHSYSIYFCHAKIKPSNAAVCAFLLTHGTTYRINASCLMDYIGYTTRCMLTCKLWQHFSVWFLLITVTSTTE